MSIKYCINCKFFNEKDARCKHPVSMTEIDYVFGESNSSLAKDMREGSCGSDAFFFQLNQIFLVENWK